jgi:DNA-binding response OmpR family regulator
VNRRAEKRVLIIDDEQCFTELMAMNLDGHRGIEVRCVNDPMKSLALAINWRPNLILLDLIMPGLCGDELFRQLRSHPALARVPVILLSASTEAEQRVQGSHLQYLPKPMPADVLIQAVDSHLFQDRPHPKENYEYTI